MNFVYIFFARRTCNERQCHTANRSLPRRVIPIFLRWAPAAHSNARRAFCAVEMSTLCGRNPRRRCNAATVRCSPALRALRHNIISSDRLTGRQHFASTPPLFGLNLTRWPCQRVPAVSNSSPLQVVDYSTKWIRRWARMRIFSCVTISYRLKNSDSGVYSTNIGYKGLNDFVLNI